MLVDTKQLIRLITIFSCYFICETTDPLKGCTDVMYVTNEIINNLIPAVRDLIIQKSIEQYSFTIMVNTLLPLDSSEVARQKLDSMDISDREAVLQYIIKSNIEDQNEIVNIDETEIEEYVQSYDGERDIRIQILLPSMMRVLHYAFGLLEMCYTDGDKKCELMALIKSFSNPQNKYTKAKCVRGQCVITEITPDGNTLMYNYVDKKKFNLYAACYLGSTFIDYILWMGK
ncbi:uncharacterized protein LOC126838658 [Adelges cooleyi]|uniref:uncharacterized protein LOC126838658 n=1 Tax=Adelges cooleyi TaxID=133065 RepID=UPI00217F82B4|nr:uncharacterized protein LOC126838658 [Adelges cooleyi]XP_050429219.1 uncharacterized protein LOC126838658 [Adelges cooleyi]